MKRAVGEPMAPGQAQNRTRNVAGSRVAGPRIALYSHDAMGLGHMRRNLLIADTFRRFPTRASVLLIAGAGELNAFGLPPGVDCLTLPALSKNGDGSYRSRSLKITVQELTELRANMILAALEEFRPDLFVVDKLPRGVMGELERVLRYLRLRTGARVVLGLRDVLDEPAAVRREWSRLANERAIRSFYDAIWVYGDPAIYDPVEEYGFAPDLAARVRFTGYLDPGVVSGAGESAELRALNLPPGRLALCQVGGGQDGGGLAEAFVRATLPEDMNGVVLTGPFMPQATRRSLEARAARNARLRVLRFVPEPLALLSCCDRLVAMGGYNTVREALALEKPVLIVPRVHPRREQFVRAQRFAELGLLDVLPPDRLTPAALSDWLAREVVALVGVRERIDFGGLARLPQLLREVLDGRRRNGRIAPLRAVRLA